MSDDEDWTTVEEPQNNLVAVLSLHDVPVIQFPFQENAPDLVELLRGYLALTRAVSVGLCGCPNVWAELQMPRADHIAIRFDLVPGLCVLATHPSRDTVIRLTDAFIVLVGPYLLSSARDPPPGHQSQPGSPAAGPC